MARLGSKQKTATARSTAEQWTQDSRLRVLVPDTDGVGKQPQKKRRLKTDMDATFLALVITLLTIGLIMLFSASYAYAYYNYGNSFHFITRQLGFAVIGIVAMLMASRVDYRVFHRLALPIMVISIVLLVVVLFMPARNNAHRWIGVGSFTIQPSEIAKFAITVMFAQLISINHKEMHTFKKGVAPFAIILGIVSVLMLLEPHLSGTILILALGLLLMLIGGTRLRYFALAGILIAAVLGYLVFFTDAITYATDRLQGWLDPFHDPLNSSFQTVQSLLAIGSGGVMGLGLGNSRQKYLYVPEPQNDFIFSIVCEELGFVGAVIIILLFLLLVWRGLVIAMRCKDRFGAILAVGLTMQVGLQALLNIAVVTNTIPNTGISLPFFSSGGSSLVMLLGQMGIVLSISRHSRVAQDEAADDERQTASMRL